MKQKGFLSAFYPDEWMDSTYSIDFEDWYRRGFRGIIFDIDNTLVPHGAPADERALALFARLHSGRVAAPVQIVHLFQHLTNLAAQFF